MKSDIARPDPLTYYLFYFKKRRIYYKWRGIYLIVIISITLFILYSENRNTEFLK